MVKTYVYKLPARFDPYYLRAILARDFPDSFMGWSETPTEIRIDFTRELTSTEKAKLDTYIANPPMPVAVYEFGAIDLADEIEKAVGVRPVLVDYDDERDRGRIMFDKALTSTQEAALQAFIQGLRTKRIFKRRS